jgi:predicted RNA binding protein YcfA (HicA-like mRNA interferase family)
MNWTQNVWIQIKNITADELISALEKDKFTVDAKKGAIRIYYNPHTKRRVSVHYHPKKTFKSPKLLKGLIDDAGWEESDLRRLKLIK